MKRIFGRKSEKTEQLQEWGCLSRRENDFVVIAGEREGTINISRLPRKASLETLRLQGKIRTAVPSYHARAARLEELRFEGNTDYVQIGLSYLDYLKKQKFSLKDKRVAFTFDDTGTVTSNSARQKDVVEAAVSVEGFRSRVDESCPVEVESRGRAAMRLFLKLNVPHEEKNLTVAAIVVEEAGYSILFFNTEKGICWEAEQPFIENESEDNWLAVADEIRRLIAPASLESLGINAVNHIVLVSGDECLDFLNSEFSKHNIRLETIQFDEGSHFTLNAGSQSFNSNKSDAVIAAGLYVHDPRIAHINLNLDLEADLREKASEQVRITQRQQQTSNRNLSLLLVSPVILAIVCCSIFYLTLCLKDSYVTKRQENAKAKEEELQTTVKELENVKNSADQLQKVGTLIESLRKKQPANFLLFMTLNRIFPSGGGAWQIDEITSKPDGTVSIKGKTTSDEMLAEFVKNLDFSPDFEGVKASKGENPTGSVISADDSIKKFAIEARYLPLTAQIKPATTAPPVQSAPVSNQIGTNPPQIAVQGTPKQPNS